MKNLILEYDESVDAAYLAVSHKPWDHQIRLDDSRGINYAADGTVIGIEILSLKHRGVCLTGIPFKNDVARALRAAGFQILEDTG
jgi:uncharacterized protein YuzE